MAEINKLDVGKALDKMRTETPKARMAQLDEKLGELEEETRRIRAMSNRVGRSPQAPSTLDGSQRANASRVTTTKVIGTVIGIVIVIPILVLMVGLFSR